jgi:hypothetical protein
LHVICPLRGLSISSEIHALEKNEVELCCADLYKIDMKNSDEKWAH